MVTYLIILFVLEQTTSNQFFLELKMPKFLKACNNRHFHQKWSESENSTQIISLVRIICQNWQTFSRHF